MEGKASVFCWHYSGEPRLKKFLKERRVDCPSLRFLDKHRLKPGDRIRFSVKVPCKKIGQILATAELVSKTPYELKQPRNDLYTYVVDLKNIELLEDAQFCPEYKVAIPHYPMNPSHRPTEPTLTELQARAFKLL